MKAFKIFIATMFVAAFSSCSKDASDVVNDIYSSMQSGDVANVIQYCIPDSVGELTDSEKEMFAYELSGMFSKDLNTIQSFEVIKVDVDTLGNHADFEVKTVHSNGTFNEKGSINKNPETGHWTLRLDSVYTENPKEATTEVMPQLRAATYKVLSAKGVPYYMCEYAKILEENIYGTKDPSQSFNLYKKAAEAGYTPAYYRLGNCYMNGYGTDKDREKAFEAYEKGAEANDTNCIYELARCYENGNGTSKDPAKVFELAKKLYELNPNSGYLSYCYYYGIGTPKDLEKSFQLDMKLAMTGNAGGMYNVGIDYYYGRGVQKDYAEAIKWYKKAVDAGDVDALNNLGWMYADGEGTEKDYDEAVRLFRMGADKGNAYCMNSLGIMYRDGKGVNKDIDRARNLFQNAADKGNLAAKNNLNNLWRY